MLMPKSSEPKESKLCQEEINPVTRQSKNGRPNILNRATKSVEHPKRKLSAERGRLLISRIKGAKRAALDAGRNPVKGVRATVGAKAAKQRKNRHMPLLKFPSTNPKTGIR